MRNKGKMCVIAALALLLALATGAQAALYVEGFLGGTTAGNLGGSNYHQSELPAPPPVTVIPTPPPTNNVDSKLFFSNSGAVAPSLIGGGRLGYWFVPEGALGYNYPDWMKYFGVYTDVSFQGLNVKEQSVSVADFNDAGVFRGNFSGNFYSHGYVVTWAFMFAARYGFLPSDKVPFGRLQPWVAVGPAILFTGMKPKARVYDGSGVGGVANPGWQSTVVPALVVDAGLRYMLNKRFSLDFSFRYRYAQSTLTLTSPIFMGYPRNSTLSQFIISSAAWRAWPTTSKSTSPEMQRRPGGRLFYGCFSEKTQHFRDAADIAP